MLIGTMENQARQLAQERDDLIAEKIKLQSDIDDQKATIAKLVVVVKEED